MAEKSGRVAITTSSFGTLDNLPLERLRERGYDVVLNPFGRALKETEAKDFLSGVDPVGLVAGTEPLNETVLKNIKALKGISRVGAGIDNVDLDYAAARGIAVASTPEATILPVAELAVGLILSLLRHVPQMDRALRAGEWKKMTGSLLHGKSVGIVGAGRIGRKVAELLQAFGAKIRVFDLHLDAAWAAAHSVESVPSVAGLFAVSDIVTLHVSGGPASKNLISESVLSSSKKGLLLVNLSRGEVVNELALVAALESKKIGGAALDVFENEPYSGPLTKMNNVILTPHIGSATNESRVEMERQAVDNLLAILARTR